MLLPRFRWIFLGWLGSFVDVFIVTHRIHVFRVWYIYLDETQKSPPFMDRYLEVERILRIRG